MIERTKFQCAARGCDGCTVCDDALRYKQWWYMIAYGAGLQTRLKRSSLQ